MDNIIKILSSDVTQALIILILSFILFEHIENDKRHN
jgi:hypothetical protein